MLVLFMRTGRLLIFEELTFPIQPEHILPVQPVADQEHFDLKHRGVHQNRISRQR